MTPITKRQILRQAAPLVGLGALAAALSGCGGATTNGSSLAPTKDSGPVIYGISALALDQGLTTGETSGLSFTGADGTAQAALVGAFAYKTVTGAGPLAEYQSDFPNSSASTAGLPLGFAPAADYYNSSAIGMALPTTTTGNLVFGAYISNGSVSTKPVDLNTGSIVLTSSEDPAFSVPLTFIGIASIGTGILSQTQYQGTFPMPAFLKTTGLHDLHTTIADVAGQSSTTDFNVLSLAPTDSAVFTPVTAVVPAGQPSKTQASINSYTATITAPIAGVATYTTVDATNNIILFAAPGSQTTTVTANVTLSHPDGTTLTVTQTGTETDTLVAGQVFLGKGIKVAGSTPATASARPRASRLVQH